MIKEYFRGSARLTTLLFRQHKLKIFIWLVSIIGISLVVALAYPEIYPTMEDVMGFAATMDNPAMSALIGANYVLEEYNIGAVFASEMLLFTTIAVSVMNILLTKTFTREDEESGRVEIVQSLPVGKLSYLTAGLSLMLFVNVTLVFLLTVGLAVLGTNVFTWESSLLYGSILGISGLLFAGVTGISAQLSSTSHGTSMIAFGVLFFSYLIRAIGDVQNEVISYFSPLGWATKTEVFVNDYWLPILVLATSSIILILGSLYLHARRDMFSGLLPNRRGKREASTLLKTTPGFVWYLEKGKIIIWFILLFVLSLAFGAILGELEIYFADLDVIQVFLQNSGGSNTTEQFVTLLIGIMSSFSVIPSVLIILSLKSEELKGRVEHLYIRTISRNKLLGTYVGWSVISAILMQLSIAMGLYLTSTQVLNQPIELITLIEIAMIYLPAMFLIIGLAIFFLGNMPKLTLVNWLYVAFVFIVLYLGDLLELPSWLENLSAFHHIPDYPSQAINWTTIAALLGIGLVFTVVGFIGYNRRDLNA